jgi:hypothetical protein
MPILTDEIDRTYLPKDRDLSIFDLPSSIFLLPSFPLSSRNLPIPLASKERKFAMLKAASAFRHPSVLCAP